MDKKEVVKEPVDSLLEIHKDFEIEAYGPNKKDAYTAVFTKLKKLSYESVKGLILLMEPEHVLILEEHEKIGKEKLLGFLAPRQIQTYYVRLKIVVRMKYIPD